jgi:hypothetical protein
MRMLAPQFDLSEDEDEATLSLLWPAGFSKSFFPGMTLAHHEHQLRFSPLCSLLRYRPVLLSSS